MPLLKTKRQIGRVPAGTVRKFTAYEARALVALGHAEPYTPPTPAATPAAEPAAPVRARREYKRRDMQAEAPATAAVVPHFTKDDA